MTNQEEIRAGLDEILIVHNSETGSTDNDRTIDRIFSYLHSQGVVSKGESLGGSHPHLANYFAVEDLFDIEE